MRCVRVALVLVVGLAAPASAGIGGPVFHGPLTVRATRGKLDPFGTATLRARRWTFVLGLDDRRQPSNGIDLAQEPVVLALGEESFVVPAGALRSSKRGTRFTYRSATTRGVRRLRLVQRGTDTWEFGFTIVGANLSVLKELEESCRPFAIVIGDDDGFRCLRFERPPRSSKRYALAGTCEGPEGCTDWPWTR